MAQDDTPKPVTMEQALKLGPEKLTAIVGASEAGQDIACGIYAAAKRLQTENRLAKTDLRLVVDLDWLRGKEAPSKALVDFVISQASWIDYPGTGKKTGGGS